MKHEPRWQYDFDRDIMRRTKCERQFTGIALRDMANRLGLGDLPLFASEERPNCSWTLMAPGLHEHGIPKERLTRDH